MKFAKLAVVGATVFTAGAVMTGSAYALQNRQGNTNGDADRVGNQTQQQLRSEDCDGTGDGSMHQYQNSGSTPSGNVDATRQHLGWSGEGQAQNQDNENCDGSGIHQRAHDGEGNR